MTTQNILQEVETKLRDGSLRLNPVECGEWRAKLSGEFSFLSSQLEDILLRKPLEWNEMRPKFKSDTACERQWEATEDGINEMGLRMRLKRCERLLSGLRSLIKIHEADRHNTY